MQQTLLRLSLPKDVTFWPEDFRGAVAAQNRVAPALFGRDEAGQTVSNPSVRFVGGRRWVGLVADPGHESLLFEHLGTIMDAATGHIGQPMAMEVERHELALVPSTYPRFYRVRQMALKRRSTVARESTIEDLVAQRVANSLVKQADAMGIDCPPTADLEVANVHVDRQLGLQLRVQGGPTAEFMSLVPSLTFSVFAELRGLWFVGSLSARGYGRIVHELRALPKVA